MPALNGRIRLLAAAQAKQADHLVICGAGASAVLLVRALQRFGERPLDVTIIDPRQPAGVGLAYSTPSPSHLLNVPAGRMSADEDQPNAFVEWLQANDPQGNHTAKSFVPRHLFGSYLRGLLSSAIVDKRSMIQVRILHASVSSITRANGHWTLSLDDERLLDADAVVIATGNAPPRPWLVNDAPHERVSNDPWNAQARAAIPRSADVALIGSGLTAVDIAVELLDRGHQGQIRMVSRHGLLPRKHAPAMISGSWLFPPYPESIADLMHQTREAVRAVPGVDSWRTAVDSLRPNLPAIWNALSGDDRARFLRHVRPFWEVHRHRMAPEVAQRIDGAIADDRIVIHAGRLLGVNAKDGDHTVELRMRARGHVSTLKVEHVINCTGPECDPTKSSNALIVDLLRKGLCRADPLHLGIDTDATESVIGANGEQQPNLYALGPVARGRLWEVTAVPEIRQQAASLSRVISPRAVELVQSYTI